MIKKTISLSISETKAFSPLVNDYISKAEALEKFYNQVPTLTGIKEFINEKKNQPINRVVLVDVLKKQYANINVGKKVQYNLEAFLQDNTFTICTAHQPIIYGGPLYFIYKIAHTIQLAQILQKELPAYNFVPVFYMGSEDADIDEIGTCQINGKKYTWQTPEKGACGRFSTDSLQDITKNIIANLDLQNEHGQHLQTLLQAAYNSGKTLARATLQLVNEMFGEHGLIVLNPDDIDLKKQFAPIMEQEILHRKSEAIVHETSEALEKNYKVQAHARSINLFYLVDGLRERIDWDGNNYIVLNTNLAFTESQILNELHKHPERFSPNVILRGVFQETILPNVAFIGGGGELAYWLQLKKVFAMYKTPLPPIVLRQSFALVNNSVLELIGKNKLEVSQLFEPLDSLKKLVVLQSDAWQSLEYEHALQAKLIQSYKNKASNILPQLQKSMEAFEAKYKKLEHQIQKKFIAHSKRKQTDNMQALEKIKSNLFPNNNLQERVENFIPFYNSYGKDFINDIIENCLPFGDEFIVANV